MTNCTKFISLTYCGFALIFQIGSENASSSQIMAGVRDLVQESGLQSDMSTTGTIIGKNIILEESGLLFLKVGLESMEVLLTAFADICI